jgi:hypothetical protein
MLKTERSLKNHQYFLDANNKTSEILLPEMEKKRSKISYDLYVKALREEFRHRSKKSMKKPNSMKIIN